MRRSGTTPTLTRNRTSGGTFEWLASFDTWKLHLDGFLRSSGEKPAPSGAGDRKSGDKSKFRFANIGCGYSLLHEELYTEGYTNIMNTDVKKDAIEKMKARAAGGPRRSGVKWKMDDIRNSKLESGSFDVVIEKSTLDFIVAESLADALKMIFHIHRILKLGGKYITVSMHPPSVVLPLLRPIQSKHQALVSVSLPPPSQPSPLLSDRQQKQDDVTSNSIQHKEGQLHPQSTPKFVKIPPPSSAPPSTRPTFVYCYERNQKEDFFEGLVSDACKEIEKRWAESREKVSSKKRQILEKEFQRRGKGQGFLPLKHAYHVLFDELEPISTEYSFEDFTLDLLRFRSSRSARRNEEKEDRGEAMNISVEEACSFLEEMG